MPINQFSCSCEETLREASRRTREEPREMVFTPDPSLLLLTLLRRPFFVLRGKNREKLRKGSLIAGYVSTEQ